LSYLIKQNHKILLVICNQENGENQWFPSLEDYAKKLGLQTIVPKSVNTNSFISRLKALEPDIGFSIFSSFIFKNQFIELFPNGLINLHFAPLPKYRGCMPISWAIINGEKNHGVTIHYIDEGIDTGDIISQVNIPIKNDDTALDLYKNCEIEGYNLFKSTLESIISGTNDRKVQDHDKMTYYKRNQLRSFEVIDKWDDNRKFNFIRALTFPPLKPAYMIVNGEKVFITSKIY